ncbi:MAG: helix-turn-helix domain-containing protein [Saccharofermentans sp.]|nr:helix-turn-helix domain-containing protein [Saccharofermentans sp.]
MISKFTKVFLEPKEVAEIVGVSMPTAYRIIRELNIELQEKGFVIQIGKVNKKYFEERFGVTLDYLPDQINEEKGA